ncbi:MAG TPA: alpha/beta fold hydrolase [Candidatus Dormibacteraeota bacterium]
MLHAFPLDASQWDHQVAVLGDRWRCLRADAFGCGSSPPPAPGLTLDDVAAGVLGALDERGVGEVAVVGLSMGGYTAMAMLRAAPERVRALVLADTRDGADADGARADRLEMARRVRAGGVEPIVEPMVQRLLSATGREEPHIADPLRSRIRHCTPEGIAACQEAMAARPDSSEVVAAVRVPTLVVCGAEDAVTTPEEMRTMAARISGARFSVVEGAGHLANLEQPAAFGELLAGFLDEAYTTR